VSKPPGRPGKVGREEFAKLWDELSRKDIAQRLGVSPCSVTQRALRMELPPQGQRPYTQDFRDRVLADVAKGHGPCRICRDWLISRSTVDRWVREASL
jgi:hypothetical protein